MNSPLYKPTATAGQVVNDLHQIVETHPDLFLEYSNDDGNGLFVTGVVLHADMAVLQTSSDRHRAATLEQLLAMMSLLRESVGVVLQDDWQLLNLEPDAEGAIITYDEDDDYCLFRLGRDVRLLTTRQMLQELETKGLHEYPDCEVVAVSKSPLLAYPLNALQWHDNILCFGYTSKADADSITVSTLLDEFPDCAELMVRLKGRFYTITEGEKGIFFGFTKEGTKYLGFYLGEVVYDPK